jgi:hypothetical protein
LTLFIHVLRPAPGEIQEQFVDAPADAVAASHVLVIAVMSARGYPTDHPDRLLADLSVEHASTLDRYRSAEQISGSTASGTASTEDLRLAVIGYRALFRDLLGEPDALPSSAAAEALAVEPDDMRPSMDRAQAAEAQVTIPASDPASEPAVPRSDGQAAGTRPSLPANPPPTARATHVNGSASRELEE